MRFLGRVWDPYDMKFKDLLIDDSVTDEQLDEFLAGLHQATSERPDNN